MCSRAEGKRLLHCLYLLEYLAEELLAVDGFGGVVIATGSEAFCSVAGHGVRG